MEKVFLVRNNELEEINRILSKGGSIKMIQPVTEMVSSYGYAGGETSYSDAGHVSGNIFAYIVVNIKEE